MINCFFLAISTDYKSVQVGLLSNNKMISSKEIDKNKASALLIVIICEMLKKEGLNFTDLSFISVNQGPGPFTTLRTIFATVNGISFSSNVKLVGVDGIKTFLIEEQKKNQNNKLVAILNAFGQDLYFAYYDNNNEIVSGCKPSKDFFQLIKNEYLNESIKFIGNGTSTYFNEILEFFINYKHDESNDFVNIFQIADQGLIQFQENLNLSNQLLPIYFKELKYKKSISLT